MDAGEGPFWAYVLENPSGCFYIGHTDNLQRRLAEHNDAERAKANYTRKHGPWRLVWSEQHSTRSSAMGRECRIKAMKSARWIRQNVLN